MNGSMHVAVCSGSLLVQTTAQQVDAAGYSRATKLHTHMRLPCQLLNPTSHPQTVGCAPLPRPACESPPLTAAARR
jgi:hypothetical protein